MPRLPRFLASAAVAVAMALSATAAVPVGPASAASLLTDPVPIAAYGMEESRGTAVGDSMGGKPGTAVATSWTAGKHGKALSFAGEDYVESKVAIPPTPAWAALGALTFEAWIKPASDADGNLLELQSWDSSNGFFVVGYRWRTLYAVYCGVEGCAGISGDEHGFEVPEGSWSHVAVTHDGTALRIYLNGTQVAVQEATVPLPSFDGQRTIGGAYDTSADFDGVIDEVRVYGTAIDEARVRADMETPVTAALPDDPPSAVGAFTAAGGKARADLSWTAATDDFGVTGYEVHRSSTAGFEPTAETLLATVTTPKYADTGIEPAGRYYYRVLARDILTNGPPSQEAAADVGPVDRPTGSLLAAYALDEGSGTLARDASGKGNHGTVDRATWTEGKHGSALDFPRTGRRMVVPDPPSLRVTSGLTLEMWMRPRAVEPYDRPRYIVAKKASGSPYPSYSVKTWGPRDYQVLLTMADGTPLSVTLPPPPVDQWTHLAVTFDYRADRYALTVYVNGAVQRSLETSRAILYAPGDFQLGSDGFTDDLYIPVTLDDVRVYSKALTGPQIRADMLERVS
ncbi:LamG-like jellyroll fold domain-containing protein [Sphaerisporangium sp. NPDC049002]|uniref:LamG-like jellyroll fold domain-containing protein n=1 Tax=unclassified Sphaerisporangium TaxID=2630420 RepID=UPI0033E602E7